MSWIRANPRFAATMAALGLLVIVEGVSLTWMVRRAHAAHRRYQQVSREWRTLRAGVEAPDAPTEEEAKAEFDRALRALGELRYILEPDGPNADRLHLPANPMSRADAFIDTATFVQAMRTRARQMGVEIDPDEHFGFSGYFHAASAAESAPDVRGERLSVQYLLEALLDAHPRKLVAVQRGSSHQAAPPAKGQGTTPVRGQDYFQPDAWPEARDAGADSRAIRISFIGRTPALRDFLNRAAELRLPLVVRTVTVAPESRLIESGGKGPAAPTPLVQSQWSRFTVTVEFLSFAPIPSATS